MPHPRSTRTAFTLKELLIVVGIISFLIAILIPVLSKARRRALVLACPIVYVASTDPPFIQSGGKSVHLASPSGTDLEIYRAPGDGKVHDALWSPTGQRLAILVYNGMVPGTQGAYLHKYDVLIMDPASGRTKTWKEADCYRLQGWVDDTHLAVHGNGWEVMNVETGVRRRISEWSTRFSIEEHSPAPHHSDARFVAYGTWWERNASNKDEQRFGIAMAKKDFSRGKVIYREWRMPHDDHRMPAIDPMGEWVAWTKIIQTGGLHSSVLLKHVKAPAGDPPQVVMEGVDALPRFCDWTEDGRLLVIGQDKGFIGLLLVDKAGKLLNRVPTEKIPWRAHWRHYRHR